MTWNTKVVIKIRYASIRSMDISNGEGIGVALFVQGCHFHCKNCFNQETWDFNGGKEWTRKTELEFRELVKQPYITRASILGGEPLAEENIYDVYHLILELVLHVVPHRKIWLYTGYTLDEILEKYKYQKTMKDSESRESLYYLKLFDVISLCDFVVDGPYIDSLRDMNLRFRGSSNQRIISTGNYFSHEPYNQPPATHSLICTGIYPNRSNLKIV